MRNNKFTTTLHVTCMKDDTKEDPQLFQTSSFPGVQIVRMTRIDVNRKKARVWDKDADTIGYFKMRKFEF